MLVQVVDRFIITDPAPDVRLLTPKPRPGAPPPSKTIKSKGCAFLEFFNKSSLQQGLRLHHSVLDGRQINVELTAGGGGNSTSRVAKLKERNKELHGQRVLSL
jgi:nucleolar protein 6